MPATSDTDKALCACFFKCRLSANPCGNKGLHDLIRVLKQCHKLSVTLGESVSVLARSRTDLHGWAHIVGFQQLCKLGATVEDFLRDLGFDEQLLFALFHLDQVRFKFVHIEF